MGQPLMMVCVQAGGGAASHDGTCAGWKHSHWSTSVMLKRSHVTSSKGGLVILDNMEDISWCS